MWFSLPPSSCAFGGSVHNVEYPDGDVDARHSPDGLRKPRDQAAGPPYSSSMTLLTLDRLTRLSRTTAMVAVHAEPSTKLGNRGGGISITYVYQCPDGQLWEIHVVYGTNGGTVNPPHVRKPKQPTLGGN